MIYRSKFWIMFLHILGLYTLLVVIDDGFDINYEAFLVGLIFVMLFSVVATYYFKITTFENHIRAYDFWGKYHSLEWRNITKVKSIQIVGLKYLRVYGDGQARPLWIPCFLRNMDEFVKDVHNKISHENPLYDYLQPSNA